MTDKMELKELLPGWYDGIHETNVLMSIEDELLEEIRDHIQRAQSNQYISTADSQTLSLYEQMLNIPVQSGDTLSIRRFRILNRMIQKRPYTIRYFEEVFWAIKGSVGFQMDYSNYTLNIQTSFDEYGPVAELEYLLRNMIPANIKVNAVNESVPQAKARVYLAAGIVLTEIVEINERKGD